MKPLFSLFGFVCTVIGILLCGSCSPVLVTTPFSPEGAEVQNPAEPASARTVRCMHWENYSTREPSVSPRSIRVNFHVMDNAAGNAHLSPDSVRHFLLELLELANAALDTNVRNWRSPDGTPVLPKKFRYVLTPQQVRGDDGIYFHYDDELWYFVSQGRNQNNFDRTVVNKYGIGQDSIMNIFVLVHPPDSINSPTYRANAQGIALGTNLKIAGFLELGSKPEHVEGLLNHEIGHILGVNHAWIEDGCPDTENHPNQCWTWSRNPPCNTTASNNLMDYNAYQIAMTPCQLGRVHATFSNEKHPVRKCLIRDWCTLDENASVVVQDSAVWTGARDLKGHLIVAENGALELRCRLSMPAGSYIMVRPGGRLWLNGARIHNDCEMPWLGLFAQSLKGQTPGAITEISPSQVEHVEKTQKVRLRQRIRKP